MHALNVYSHQRVHKFADWCCKHQILLQDGLKLFQPRNIYLKKEDTEEIPFIGYDLWKAPWVFRGTTVPPQDLRMSEEAAKEMHIRYLQLHQKVKDMIHKRFHQRVETRSTIGPYKDFSMEIKGRVSDWKKLENPSLITICLENIVETLFPDKVIVDHAWVLIPVSIAKSQVLTIGKYITATARIDRYRRYSHHTGTHRLDYRFVLEFDSIIVSTK